MSLTVVWGKERYHLELDSDVGRRRQQGGDGDDDDYGGGQGRPLDPFARVTLKMLKEWCRDKTGVPLAGMRIIYAGAILKDESASLASFGLGHGSKLTLMGNRPDAKDISASNASSSEEAAYITQIQALLKKAYAYSDEVSSFEGDVVKLKTAISTKSGEKTDGTPASELSTPAPLPTPAPTSAAAPATTASAASRTIPSSLDQMRPGQVDAIKASLFMTHRRLSELLTQSLIALDGVSLSNEHAEARKQRKEGVREVQAWLDRVDRAQASLR